MKKIKSIVIFYWILVVTGVAGGFLMMTGWTYPLKQVSKPLAECKSVYWDKMPDGCAIDLPKITAGDSGRYKSQELYRLIYSDLWGGTYDDGWDVMSGSSPGVDIVTAKGTPVYSIADGVVVQAAYKFGIGNSITIKHSYNGSYIYSSYSHLDVMGVKVGDTVKEGQEIGKVGNTGTTFGQYGNHLDFQITTTTQWYYPYSYHDCNVGLSYYDIINGPLCRSYMITNTADPIAFLEKNGATKNIITPSVPSSGSGTKQTITLSGSITPTTVVDPVHSVATVPTPTSSSTSTVKQYQYQILGLSPQDTIESKRKFVFFIKVYDVGAKKLYEGKLAHRIVVRDTKGIIAFDSPVITSVKGGVAKVTGLGITKGYSDLKVEIAGKEVGSYGITIK